MPNPCAPPARAAATTGAVRRVELPSFLRFYSIAIVGSASLFGAFATLQLMSSGRPGLAQYAAQFVSHDGLRSVGPLASTAALVLALMFWAERQRPNPLRRRRRQGLRRARSLPHHLVRTPGLCVVTSHGQVPLRLAGHH